MSTWPFIAEINILPYTFAPMGYTFCDGQLLPVNQNQALFSLIGTIYGGDGRTTVGVPNLRGRSPMNLGNGAGLSSYRLGNFGGSPTVPLAPSQLPTHNHSWNVILEGGPDKTQGPNFTMGIASDGTSTIFMYSKTAQQTNQFFADEAVTFEGANEGHENRQPWLALNFCIALEGQYPARS